MIRFQVYLVVLSVQWVSGSLRVVVDLAVSRAWDDLSLFAPVRARLVLGFFTFGLNNILLMHHGFES